MSGLGAGSLGIASFEITLRSDPLGRGVLRFWGWRLPSCPKGRLHCPAARFKGLASAPPKKRLYILLCAGVADTKSAVLGAKIWVYEPCRPRFDLHQNTW